MTRRSILSQWKRAALLLAGGAALLLTGLTAAAPPAAPRPAPDEEAKEFVRQLLVQRPAKELAIEGFFQVRDAKGRRTQMPVRYFVRLGPQDWESVYETKNPAAGRGERLVVTHRSDSPNRYELKQIDAEGASTSQLALTGDEAAVPFAGSDFWLSDLGLEFLHWPEQRFVRDAKITMKWGRPMKVIESVNPQPGTGGYSRVVSWIDSELGSLVRAEAYDAANRKFKVFELKSFRKVNGRWQVKDMEIRNDHSDTRTRLECQFET